MSFDHLGLGKDDKVRKILQKHADGIYDEIILYSNRVTKINKKSKAQQRVLVITDKAIYNFTPAPAKSRSFSIKQFFESPQEAKEAERVRRNRHSIHSSLKTQPEHNEGVGQMKRRIVLKQIHTISVSSQANEIVLHVPNEYDYLYRLATFQDVEQVVRVLQESSQAVNHFPKAYQFELENLCPISDNAKSRKKGNETQDQYMQRKLRLWKQRYKVKPYDVKKIIKPQEPQSPTRKKNNTTTISLKQPYTKSRAISVAPNAYHAAPNRPNRSTTNFGAPQYFNKMGAKSLTVHGVRGSVYSQHQYTQSMQVNGGNLVQLQQQFPPPAQKPMQRQEPLQKSQTYHAHGRHHRQVYSESFSTNPQYAQRMQMMGAMAYNQQTAPNKEQSKKRRRRRHSHSESSCGSSCSCSSGSETGSSYTASSDTGSRSSTDDEASTTYTATATATVITAFDSPQTAVTKPPELDLENIVDMALDPHSSRRKKHIKQSSVHIVPSSTAITPKNRSPIPMSEQKQIEENHAKVDDDDDDDEDEEDEDDEDENYRHNLNARRAQKRKNHNRYAQTQILPSNQVQQRVAPVKQMPARALPNMQVPRSPNRPLPINNGRNATIPSTTMKTSRSWTPTNSNNKWPNNMNNNNNQQWNNNANHNRNFSNNMIRNSAQKNHNRNFSNNLSNSRSSNSGSSSSNFSNNMSNMNNGNRNRNNSNHNRCFSNNLLNRKNMNNMNNNNNINNMNNMNMNNMNNVSNVPNVPQSKFVSSILEAKELPVNNKEAYLPDNLFWEVFKMSKQQFYAQRSWQQKKMKRYTGLF